MALKTSITNLKKNLALCLQNVPGAIEAAMKGLAEVETEAESVDETIVDVEAIKNIMADNAGAHNAIYRGKNLGSSVTTAQYAAIEAGTFDDMYIGDYWEIGSVKWRIAHFDYWLDTGDVRCTDHHVVIVPDSNLYSAAMNAENVTTGGYYSSAMRGGADYLVENSSALYQASEAIKTNFGAAHILTHRVMLTNAVTTGIASDWAWYDSSVDLMSEVMTYGTLAWSAGGKGYEVGDDKTQLALFRHDITKVTNRADWWLRGVRSAATYANVNSSGNAGGANASTNLGVRPAFAIKGNTETRKPIPPNKPDKEINEK